jgi:hypothetical protein
LPKDTGELGGAVQGHIVQEQYENELRLVTEEAYSKITGGFAVRIRNAFN